MHTHHDAYRRDRVFACDCCNPDFIKGGQGRLIGEALLVAVFTVTSSWNIIYQPWTWQVNLLPKAA